MNPYEAPNIPSSVGSLPCHSDADDPHSLRLSWPYRVLAILVALALFAPAIHAVFGGGPLVRVGWFYRGCFLLMGMLFLFLSLNGILKFRCRLVTNRTHACTQGDGSDLN